MAMVPAKKAAKNLAYNTVYGQAKDLASGQTQ
jgi:hypothetical protein